LNSLSGSHERISSSAYRPGTTAFFFLADVLLDDAGAVTAAAVAAVLAVPTACAWLLDVSSEEELAGSAVLSLPDEGGVVSVVVVEFVLAAPRVSAIGLAVSSASGCSGTIDAPDEVVVPGVAALLAFDFEWDSVMVSCLQ
jgi:hypothetical protein